MYSASRSKMKNTRMILVAAALCLALGPALALAVPANEVGFRGWGPRMGLSFGPDQAHFGAHLDFGHLANHVRFQPNIEFGISDHLRLTTLNAEAAYRFRGTWDVWSPYLGGGIGANIKNFDDHHNHNSHTDIGLSLLGGIEKGLSSGDRFFIETKISLDDVPDAKITVGWTFYH